MPLYSTDVLPHAKQLLKCPICLHFISCAMIASVWESDCSHMHRGCENGGAYFSISHLQCLRTLLTVYTKWAVAFL